MSRSNRKTRSEFAGHSAYSLRSSRQCRLPMWSRDEPRDSRMTRVRFIAIVAVVAIAAAVGGLYFAGVIGGGKTNVKKIAMEPVPFTEPFIINLSDTDQTIYIKL